MRSAFALALASASAVSAHSMFQQLWVAGVDQADSCVRMPKSNSPVTSVSSNDIVCNASPSPSAGICAANAGDTVSVEMHAQPGDRSCANEAIGGNHYGPVIVYLSAVSDATSATGSDSWFKIGEFGYDASTKTWGTDVLNENCGKFDVKLPSNLPAGDYLLRAEAIALHAAGQSGGAQFYMSCYQLHIAGGSGSVPAGVKFPGAYSASDPGILINIYTGDLSSYQIPGPAVVA
ncbi:related to endoglucanase IV [Cephalotrichum gorgonifer]|uniref:lytic cellulose monooxygenase (C4-dehydrogenating) n=1 Tax=Cephalotrichum gorgonifer TaxID=2041049 RepID=A0AAE8MQZ5_9PEZI|nr:related to endoglucanase IV [Cephalotrichum gorgonifer]